ncbi:N-acetyltransferase family protein [Muricoccus radiodurans]|uniref:GNAT family N-acetyltransferase n=1 Tax=Muricoccus radiodurans TaxID=2231721 RepID=UPI003CFA9591
MMAAAAIRPAVPEDAAALAVLFRTSRAAAMPWLPVLHTPAEDLAWMRDRVIRGCTTLVAEEDGALLGFVACHGDWIEHLYLHPDHLRRGLGTRLLRTATGDQPPVLRLHAFARNAPARAFYEGHGFRPAAFGDGSTNEEGEPDVLYERHLPAQERDER